MSTTGIFYRATNADLIHDAISRADADELRKIVECFYQRVQLAPWTITDSCIYETGDWEFVLQKMGQDPSVFSDRMRVSFDGGRWRVGGQLVSTADLAELIGVPVSYIGGLSDAATLLTEGGLAATLAMLRDAKATARTERLDADRSKRLLSSVLNKFRSLLNVSIDSLIAVRIRTKERELMRLCKQQLEAERTRLLMETAKTISVACHDSDIYPDPPVPILTRKQIVQSSAAPSCPGIYFAFDSAGRVPAYVGQSINLSGRLSSHGKVRWDDLVSWISCSRLHLNDKEVYYIWRLKPYRNKEYSTHDALPRAVD